MPRRAGQRQQQLNPTAEWTNRSTARISAASVMPEAITIRSPYRSAAAPQMIKVNSTPTIGALTTKLALNSDNPSWLRRAGTSIGMP